MSFLGAVSASGSSPTTGALDTTGAKFLVAEVSYFTGGSDPPGVSDSNGNTWHALTAYATGTNSKVIIYWCAPTTVGAGHTFSSGGSFCSLNVLAFSDQMQASPLDTGTDVGAGSTSASTLQPGSITPSVNGALVITALDYGTGTDDMESVNSSFNLAATAGDGSANFRGGLAYLFQTTAAAVNPTWTLSANTQMAAAIAAFKPVGGTTYIQTMPTIARMEEPPPESGRLSVSRTPATPLSVTTTPRAMLLVSREPEPLFAGATFQTPRLATPLLPQQLGPPVCFPRADERSPQPGVTITLRGLVPLLSPQSPAQPLIASTPFAESLLAPGRTLLLNPAVTFSPFAQPAGRALVVWTEPQRPEEGRAWIRWRPQDDTVVPPVPPIPPIPPVPPAPTTFGGVFRRADTGRGFQRTDVGRVFRRV